MELLTPIKLPELSLEYLKTAEKKCFRIKSSILDGLFYHLLLNKQIRVQIWLEREVKKGSGGRTKKSWVHSIDYSNKAPTRLFTEQEYNYGNGDGWGNNTNSFSTTNGTVPTEFEITSDHVINNKIYLEIDILDIFTNILKNHEQHRMAKNNDLLKDISILGKNRGLKQPLRFKLVVKHNNKPLFSIPTNILNLGIHKNCSVTTFKTKDIKDYIRVSYY